MAATKAAAAFFESLGLSIKPTEEQLQLTLVVVVVTLFFSYFVFGRRQRRKQRALRAELDAAMDRVEELEEKLDELEMEEERKKREEKKEIRIWMDGAYDLTHFGHCNAWRQGRALGTYLIVGVNDDASITACKGTAPVLNDDERIGAVNGCRWVDEVVTHVPYVMTAEYLAKVIKDYRIDYVVHGDDPCIVDGKDVYQTARDLGIYREIPRTTGVSTTEIVGRMLVVSRDHHDRSRQSPLMGSLMSKTRSKHQRKGSNDEQTAAMTMTMTTPQTNGSTGITGEGIAPVVGQTGDIVRRTSSSTSISSSTIMASNATAGAASTIPTTIIPTSSSSSSSHHEPFVRRTKFLTTSRMIRIFSQECKEPKPNDKIVYIDGAWDLFHAGHVETLKAAKDLGDFLIVGIHNDDLVNAHRGSNYPIMNLNERVLSVLSCRYVDDVLIDAPWEISKDMIGALNISIVATGTLRDCADTHDGEKYYEIPRQMGLLRTVKSAANITVEDIVSRILSQEATYQLKMKKKTKAENEYYTKRFGFEVDGEPAAQVTIGNGDVVIPQPPDLKL